MSEKTVILYAENEKRYRDLLTIFLRSEGYEIHCVENGRKALDFLWAQKGLQRKVDLVLLDIMMDEMDGYEVCKHIREEFDTLPVIMVTALADTPHEIQGITLGADDYITKPFVRDILVARVRRLLKRTKAKEREILGEKGLIFNEINETIEGKNQTVTLSPKEYDLIKTLYLNRGQVLTRERILDLVWGRDYEGDPRTVDTHIKSLRTKISVLDLTIKTKRGVGYALV